MLHRGVAARAARVAALAGLAVAAILPAVPADVAAAPGAPTISVRPTENLPPNRKIPVTGTGFAPGTTIELRQCGAAGNVTIWRCRDDFVRVNTDAAGRFFVGFKVFRTFRNGVGADVSCRAPKTCVVSARALGTFGEVVDELASTPLHFDPTAPSAPVTAAVDPPTDLVHLQPVTISGAGWTSAARVTIRRCVANRDDCDPTPITRAVRSDRTFTTLPVRLPRDLATATGPVDCGAAPGTCELRIEESLDRELRATVPLQFDPTLPHPPEPSITIEPASDVLDEQLISVRGTGFPGSWPLVVRICEAGIRFPCTTLGDVQSDSRAALDAAVVVQRFIRNPVTEEYLDCANDASCVVEVSSNGGSWVGSAATPIGVAGEPVEVADVSPTGPYAEHQPLTLTVTGMPPDEPLLVLYCSVVPGVGCVRVRDVVAGADGRVTFTTLAHDALPFATGFRCSQSAGCEIRVVRALSATYQAEVPVAIDPLLPPFPQTVTVTPSTGLVDGQPVVVQGSGFEPSAGGATQQCANNVNRSPCRTLRFPLRTNASGAFGGGGSPVTITRWIGAPGGAGSVDCTVAPGCVVVADVAPDRVVVPITFAPLGPAGAEP